MFDARLGAADYSRLARLSGGLFVLMLLSVAILRAGLVHAAPSGAPFVPDDRAKSGLQEGSKADAAKDAKEDRQKADTLTLGPSGVSTAIRNDDSPAPKSLDAINELANGTLLIAGGGNLPERVQRQFVDLAGGADAKLVVLPGVYVDDTFVKIYFDEWNACKPKSVHILNASSAEEANEEDSVSHWTKPPVFGWAAVSRPGSLHATAAR